MKYIFSVFWLLSALSFQTLADVFLTVEKERIVNELQRQIANQYFLPENIDAIKNALTKLSVSKRFTQTTTQKELAEILAETIRKYDEHFGVLWSDPSMPQTKSEEYEGWFQKLDRKNSGFNKVEILKGNVAYIDFWGFDELNERSRRKAEAAMAFVEDSDAIIFDLRKNGGGSAVMIQFISSYFFQDKTHLNSFYSRRTGKLNEFWTFDDVNGKKRPNVPIYILTSDFTFSAAEEFAYNLKNLKRATIVGESTGGGANPLYFFDLGNGFRASIPISKAVNPITNTNWEKVGVEPDIAIDAEEAFDLAYTIALETLKPKVVNKYQLEEVNQQLHALKSQIIGGQSKTH
jgi:hypothetical protein